MELVPPGTPGAIPLKEALEIKMKELGIPLHSGDLHSQTMRRLWARGVFDKRKRNGREMIKKEGECLGRVV